MRRSVSLLLAGMLLAATAAVGAASEPVPVDPSTLTPPPNPNFTWSCVSTGERIGCRGVEHFSSDGTSPDPAFSCGGTPIVVAFTQTVTAHRVHDSLGRVLWNMQVGTFDEVWTLEGSAEPALTSRGRWTLRVDFAEPGVPESRTIVYAGAQLTVSAPGSGVVFQNTGRVATNWDESEVVAISGPQAFYEDFEGAIEAACAALGA